MRDVTALAGVSITTVLHVVNGTRSVAEETRRRVLAAVADTGYTGNAIARSLVTGGTRTLGVAISLVANPYFAELMQAIESEAGLAGFTLLLIDTHDEAAFEHAAIRALRSRRVDGLLLTPSRRASASVLPELRNLGVPTVLVDRLPADGQFDQVGPENVASTAALVTHLAECGHRRIGLVSGAAGLTTTSERTRGYLVGLHRSKLPADEALIISGESAVQPATDALKRMLALPEPPTAVVAANNNMLLGVLRATRDLGIRVGSELAIVSYDEVEWAELVDPPLTTMAQPITEIGRTAVRMLLARIGDPSRPARTVRLPAQLMHRRSCGCA